MGGRRFTDKYLEGLKPRPSPYKLRDNTDAKGFGVQVSSGGTRSFFVTITHDGAQQFIGLGRYVPPRTVEGIRQPSNLTDARDLARQLRAVAADGADPREWLQQRDRPTGHGTLGDLLDSYVTHLCDRPSARHARQTFDKDIRPFIDCTLPANRITPAMVTGALARMVRRGALVQANRTHSYLGAAFKFGMLADNDPSAPDQAVRFYLERNPVTDVKRPHAGETEGERNLSADELVAFWRALDGDVGMLDDMKTALRLLIVTGQRVETVLLAPFAEFDLERAIWDVPPGRMKKKRAHVVPLHPLAIEIVAEQRRRHRGEWLFPSPDGSGPMNPNSVSRAVARFCGRRPFEKFVPRDLRRTWKSRAGEIGIGKADRDRLQAHATGADVSSKHYDRYDYLAEKQAAMQRWGDWLAALVAAR